MRRKLLVFICCILSYVPAQSQLPDRAQHFFDLGMRARLQKHDKEAFEYMKLAINAEPAFIEAYSTLGEWYFLANDLKSAIALFKAAGKAVPGGNKAFAKPLAKSYLLNYQPAEALQVISSVKAIDNREWIQLREQALFMQKALNDKWKDTVCNLGPAINTRYAEKHPYISSDEQHLYFTRKLNGIDEDFYHAAWDSCGDWFKALNMGSPPNTSAQEYSQMISADGHYLFFTRCENRSENGWSQGGCDLFMAYRADSTWSIPQNFGGTINTPAYEGQPCLSPDNRELYFVSDRPDGYGGFDIWVARFEDGLWQLPRNAGPAINTPGNETAPFLHIDNNTLYFASDGHTGMGSSDLFYARRINDTAWNAAQNMGYPINSPSSENSISVTVDGRKAFFSSDRDSVAGNYDIYEIAIPIKQQPIPVAVIKGHTYDSMAKDHLNYTSIYISDAATGQQLYHFISNRGDGSYMMTLPAGADYICRADRIGYLDITDTIRLKNADTMALIEYNIPLLPQGYEMPITDSTIITIFFPRNSAELSEADKVTLQQAIRPWLSNKEILVMINGYTDNTGTPLINEQLSYMRAGLVAQALSEIGIDQSLIHTQGWGEAEPIAPNDTDENRSYNRRVEIVIRR